jgi:hypothetical protein
VFSVFFLSVVSVLSLLLFFFFQFLNLELFDSSLVVNLSIPAKDKTMNNTKVNAAQVWKQFEDLLAPKLNFSRTDRAIYSHLFRHSRLEGKLKFRFSIAWLARGVGLSMKATRGSVRRLVARGVLGLVERNCRSQHVVRVRLPMEIKGVRATRKPAIFPPHPAFAKIEEADFMEKQVLRSSLHEREGGNCF